MIELGDGLTLEVHAGRGHRMVMRGNINICTEDDSMTRARIEELVAVGATGKTIAWIGGGLCIGPREFINDRCTQDVYEIEPVLRRFCPSGVAFAAGDWRDTLKAKYDVIVYDLGGDVPTFELSQFLRPGGVILPEGVGSAA